MATKTLTIMEDAYDILKSKKKERESFSDVIRREMGRDSLWEIVGILSDKQADELRRNIKETRKRMRKQLDRTAKRLGA